MTTSTASAATAKSTAAAAPEEAKAAIAEQDYLFDLLGYRILNNALATQELQQINDWVDAQDLKALKPTDWIGDVQIQTYGSKDGINFQNVIEGGPIFEKLIDHPSWIDQVRRYVAVGAHALRIDECFLNVRDEGGFIPLHSGGANRRFSGLFRWHTGRMGRGPDQHHHGLDRHRPGRRGHRARPRQP